MARLQNEVGTKDFFRGTNFLTKNAPKFSPMFLSLYFMGRKKSRNIPAKFPTKFPSPESKKIHQRASAGVATLINCQKEVHVELPRMGHPNCCLYAPVLSTAKYKERKIKGLFSCEAILLPQGARHEVQGLEGLGEIHVRPARMITSGLPCSEERLRGNTIRGNRLERF